MLCLEGNERRFKTAGARLPNSRKLPRDFFSNCRTLAMQERDTPSEPPGARSLEKPV